MEIIKIYQHTIDDKGTVSNTDNICNVIDKMIRLTAKLTERYASDIVHDVDSLRAAVENGIEMDVLLFFRENGVETRATADFNADEYDTLLFNFTPIQVWRLTHNPKTMETKLIRVSVHTEWSFDYA